MKPEKIAYDNWFDSKKYFNWIEMNSYVTIGTAGYNVSFSAITNWKSEERNCKIIVN